MYTVTSSPQHTLTFIFIILLSPTLILFIKINKIEKKRLTWFLHNSLRPETASLQPFNKDTLRNAILRFIFLIYVLHDKSTLKTQFSIGVGL